MKKFILTDQKSIYAVLQKIATKTLKSKDNTKYTIQSCIMERDVNKTVNISIKVAEGGVYKKPEILFSILKDNKLEIKLKLASPYRDDLFNISEVIIEPLGRQMPRAQIKNINITNIHFATNPELGTAFSLYGKNSSVQQSIQKFQAGIEAALNNSGYLITKVKIGFFYSPEGIIQNLMADTKSPFFLRDTYRKTFFTDMKFFNPVTKLKPQTLENMIQNLLVENSKSLLILPFFGNNNIPVGYIELHSNMPNLGNELLNREPSGTNISPLINFIDSKTEDFLFDIELSYIKEWKLISEKDDIVDLGQDGKGIGIVIKNLLPESPELIIGGKIVFTISINKQNYAFYAGIKNIKLPKDDKPLNLGVKVYRCDQEEGIKLLSAYANLLIKGNKI